MDKLFADYVAHRVIESTVDDQISKLEYRIKRLEYIIDHACIGNVLNCSKLEYMCEGPHSPVQLTNNHISTRRPHPVSKALYCDKCDKLHCERKYCSHLNKFVKNLKVNEK